MSVPASAPGSRVAIIRNSKSGTAPEADALEQQLRSSGTTAEIFNAPLGNAFAPWVDRLAHDFDVLVAAGGDGTVSTVAGAVARSGKILGVIPTGTLNHFARDTGIPTDIDRAVAVISRGHERTIDVGTVNGNIFLNNVSLGNYPRMVRERSDLERKGIPDRLAGLLASARTWWDLRNLHAALRLDDRELTRRSPFIVVANGSYVLSGFAISRREDINDGQLSIYIAPATGRLGALALPIRALFGTLERHDEFESLCASTVTASFGRARIAAGIDGEVRELDAPLEFAIRRRALRVLVPSS